jgi:CRP/FNR family transcriptional regulator, cyclic AMP receptor protein
MKTEFFNKGHVIINEGELSSNAYIILSGTVKVVKSMPDGSVKDLAVLKDNQIFGECGLVDTLPRTASCVADSYVEVGVVTKDNYEKLFENNPKALLPIMKIVIERMRKTVGFIEKIYNEQKGVI